LAEGETAHPANYRGYRNAKEEMQKKWQGMPKSTTGRMFSSILIKPPLSFAAVPGSTTTPGGGGKYKYNVHAKVHARRGAIMFHPVPYPVQFVY
jgi:hypothetical protein